MLDDAYTHHDEPEKSYFSLAVRLIFRFIIDDDQWYPRHVYNNIRRDRDLIIGIGYRWAIVGFSGVILGEYLPGQCRLQVPSPPCLDLLGFTDYAWPRSPGTMWRFPGEWRAICYVAKHTTKQPKGASDGLRWVHRWVALGWVIELFGYAIQTNTIRYAAETH